MKLPASVAASIAAVLSDDLRKPKYRGDPNRMKGHCYVASESAMHLLGGSRAGWKPMNVQHENDQHWYLEGPRGEILDITSSQFKTPVPYHLARGRGFLTKEPSKRAAEVIRRVKANHR